MTKSFCVAGHVFRISIPDGHPLWPRLSNYSPFEVESDECLFDLVLEDDLNEGETESVLVSEDPDEPDMSRLDLRRMKDGGWYVEMQPTLNSPVAGRFACDEDFNHVRLKIESRSLAGAAYAVNNALMLVFAFKTATLGTLEMHSSVVVKDGKGYMFLGRSGTGKSTHSRMWLENIDGTWLLNDDNPIIRISADGKPVVYGSPWSGKTPCYKNDSAPIGALVLIRQCPENRIEQMRLPEAYSVIYSSCSGFKADSKMAEGLYQSISAVVLGVPCFLLDCLPDGDAARLCFSAAAK